MGRSMLLTKVSQHDSLKAENTELKRELTDMNDEVMRLQGQISSVSSRLKDLQQDYERTSTELTAAQVLSFAVYIA